MKSRDPKTINVICQFAAFDGLVASLGVLLVLLGPPVVVLPLVVVDCVPGFKVVVPGNLVVGSGFPIVVGSSVVVVGIPGLGLGVGGYPDSVKTTEITFDGPP